MADQVYSNNAESGLADGTAISVANSGGAAGTAFGSVQTGTQWVYATAAAKSGSLGFQVTPDATSRYLRCEDPAPSGRGGTSFWFYYQGAPASQAFLAGLRDTADALHGSVVVTTAGKIGWSNSASGAAQAGSLSASALSVGWHRVDVAVTPGTTTTTTVELNAYNAAGTSVVAWSSGATQTSATTNPVGRVRLGTVTSTSTWPTVWFDNVRWGHVASGEIGDIPNVAPTATITGNQDVAAAATVNVSVSASDSDGTIATYAWTVVAASSTSTPSLTGSSTSAISFTAPALGHLVTLQCVITDNGGATVTKTTEVRVPVAGATTLVPLALDGTNVVGTMTRVGSATTDGAALADSSDATYIESGTVSGTEQSERYRLQPSASKSAAAVNPGRLGTDTGTAHVIVRLYEGATLRETFPTQAITSTATDYVFTFAGATISAITDWGNLYVEVGATS